VSDDRRIEKLSVADALEVAVRLHQAGHLLEAEELYRNVLSVVPEHPDVLHFLGVLSHQLGRNAEGVSLVRRAVAMMPEHVDARSNLGNLLRDAGRLAEAEAEYRKAVALAPDRVGPRNNLGVVLKNQGRLEEAVGEYRAALAIQPEYVDAHHNLAAALAALGQHDEAIAAARRAIALRPDHSPAWRNLSHTLHRSGNAAEATRVLEQWLAIDPGNPVATHTLAAFGGRSAPARASDDYVKDVFDEFAGGFDLVMAGLDYRAPMLIAERIALELGGAAAQFEVLDAGCGTGLCGPLLRKYARRLVGVDLSARMIARARERGDYDELVAAELTSFLQSRDTSFDLIVSADTLVYIGDLEPFFAAAAHRLSPGGALVFTVEHAGDLEGTGSFRLEPSGRYSHSKTGLDRGLAAAGLTAGAMTEAGLRKEQGQPVAGLVVAATKRATSRTRTGST
jgi:predicted TPR repeat methyltransferase